MTEQEQTKKEQIAEIPVKKVRGKPFQKGEDQRRNLNGKPIGTKSFSTIFDEAIKEIAKKRNITPSEAEKELIVKAYLEARDGNFNFFKDLMDRKYGRAKESLDLTSGGEALGIIILPRREKKDEHILESPRETGDST